MHNYFTKKHFQNNTARKWLNNFYSSNCCLQYYSMYAHINLNILLLVYQSKEYKNTERLFKLQFWQDTDIFKWALLVSIETCLLVWQITNNSPHIFCSGSILHFTVKASYKPSKKFNCVVSSVVCSPCTSKRQAMQIKCLCFIFFLACFTLQWHQYINNHQWHSNKLRESCEHAFISGIVVQPLNFIDTPLKTNIGDKWRNAWKHQSCYI